MFFFIFIAAAARFHFIFISFVFFLMKYKTGDGLIQHRELQHVIRACMEENGMRFSEDQVSCYLMSLL